MDIKIRQARQSDQSDILDFLRVYWSSNHVFVRVPELFEFQHSQGDMLQYLLALDGEDIVGVLGYIVYGDQYEESDAFIALWKVREDYQGHIGINLMNEFSQMKFRSFSCIGIAEKVLPIYTFLGYQTGTMHHHFILNDTRETYKIAQVKKEGLNFIYQETGLCLKEVADFNEIKKAIGRTSEFFYKSESFFEKRYMQHPFYQYIFLGIYNSDKLFTVLVCREVIVDEDKILRIMDVVGERSTIYEASGLLRDYIVVNNYEYVDLYQYGLDQKKLDISGFKLKDMQKDIVPNYFEPFSSRNIDLYWATKLKDNFVFFKADGDQDRPNLLGR